MKTLSVKLGDGLSAKLTAAARRRRTTRSSVVRKALQDALRETGKPRRGSALDMARDLAGCVAGPVDLSVNKRHLKGYGR
ncbi:MAG TPA: hypothetical protein VGT02_11775 [Methylomirabilota bacterium]|jgi:Arc/MetJ-type ribon-helix-helix transcriptional regulator|nr:hypothetical protein [Methylomirabilota bacterium]